MPHSWSRPIVSGTSFDVVFQAVPNSSRPNPQKILYVIDLDLEDQYDLCQNADAVLEAGWSAADWWIWRSAIC